MSSDGDLRVMVHFAALAYIAPIPGEGLHSVEEEELYMLGGLERALADPGLITQGEWSVVWVGLNDDRGNFSYIAQHRSSGQLVVAVRGTVFTPEVAGVVDVYEDLRVGVLGDFMVGEHAVKVSYGASTAIAGVTGAKFAVRGRALSGMGLVEALRHLVSDGARTISVTGHSLGGCVATMLGLHLRDVLPDVIVQVFTFAAPTAGLKGFADMFDDAFGGAAPSANSAWRVVNRWDAVPNAWETLGDVAGWYPSPGPGQCLDVTGVLLMLALLPGSNAYAQPTVNVVTLNDAEYGSPGSLWDPQSEAPTVDGFKGQVMFQHSVVHAYMSLLGVHLPLVTPEQAAAAAGPAPVSLVESGFVHTFVPEPR
jgi:hypothetical protein